MGDKTAYRGSIFYFKDSANFENLPRTKELQSADHQYVYIEDGLLIVDSGKIVALNTPDKLIDELVETGFERPKEVKKANLEDVFIHLTGKSLRED